MGPDPVQLAALVADGRVTLDPAGARRLRAALARSRARLAVLRGRAEWLRRPLPVGRDSASCRFAGQVARRTAGDQWSLLSALAAYDRTLRAAEAVVDRASSR
jgi:hypothetical protein